MSQEFLEGPKRAILVLIVCLFVGALGVMAQQNWGMKLSGDALSVMAVGSIVPLIAAVWSQKKRWIMPFAPVIYGVAAGAGQVLILWIPTIATLIAYPNPKFPLLRALGLGGLTTVISAALGGVVGVIVLGFLIAFRIPASPPAVEDVVEGEVESLDEDIPTES